jgi:uncharacterized protein (DUF433 family)
MAVQDEERIVADPDVIGGKPRIAGTRVGVHLLGRRVEECGDDPATVAESLDLDLGDVYLALAYYHNHPDEMHDIERRKERAREQADTLTPPED